MAEDDRLLEIAAHARHGQQPTFLFMGAVKYLLGGAMAELTPEAFTAFCLAHRRELAHLVETRLVQTNAVPRSLVLRAGLTAVEEDAVHLVEVGASAGVHLRSDRYGYVVTGRRFGQLDSRVQIEAELRGEELPDLDAVPRYASATGVDLAPVDPADPDQRRWLEALVWPGSTREAALLAAALDVVAADPPPIRAGDAVEVCPRLADELPAGEPRVVFTIATRMHVPPDDRPAFDEAVLSLGANAPLYWIHAERSPEVVVRLPSGTEVVVAEFGDRISWIRFAPDIPASSGGPSWG